MSSPNHTGRLRRLGSVLLLAVAVPFLMGAAPLPVDDGPGVCVKARVGPVHVKRVCVGFRPDSRAVSTLP